MEKKSSDSIPRILDNLSKIKLNKYGSNFLKTWDKSRDEIKATLLVAEILKKFYDLNISPKVFDSGIAISIFRDKSTRTRYSFAAASNLLGLAVENLDEEKSQVSHGETTLETANMISFLTRVIGIRDDIYLGMGHEYMAQVANAVDVGFQKGILKNRPSVINLQSDVDHPTQSLSDLLHLVEFFGSLEKLKGKKMTISWAYSPSYGKPLSVPQGAIALMSRFGMNLTLAYPEGYNLIPEIELLAKKNSKLSGGSFEIVNDMLKAFTNADIVYPKSWAPYQVMEDRTKLLEKEDSKGLIKLEKKALENNAKYKNWECNKQIMKMTKKRSALYMHCLPADISGVSCKNGEVSKAVFEKYRVATYQQAGYKPFIIASMILLTQFGHKLPQVIKEVYKGGTSLNFIP